MYSASPGAYPRVTSALFGEFGTNSFPPLTETAQSFYRVQGTGPTDLNFRFKADTGSFRFQFGFYRNTAALRAIDLSTDAGREAYALMALAPGNATLVFDDFTQNPCASRTISATGGDELGFFLIPDATLASFQTSPGLFAVNGVGSSTLGRPAPFRWPLFGLQAANPGGMDQLMSFSGTSAITGRETNLFAWEDLTRASIPGNPFRSDNQFNDLIFTIEGIQAVAPVPEPSSCLIFGLGFVGIIRLRRREA